MTIQPDRQPQPPSLKTSAILGIAQILVWGGSFFLLAVLADPISKDTHWPHQWVYGSLSIGLLISGLLAPRIGRLIARQHGRTLLLYSGFVTGAGLLILSVSPNLPTFIFGWCVIGVGMAMGLYDAMFAILGNQFGLNARKPIMQITLIAGFSTTVVWPMLAWMLSQWGWRSTCLIYGLILGVVIWPLYKLVLPDDPSPLPTRTPDQAADQAPALATIDPVLFWLVAINSTIAAVIMTVISVQLIDVLKAEGLSLTAAVGLGALIGPCQVGVRLLEVLTPKRHPIWSTFISTGLTFLGLIILGLPPVFASVGVVLYSLGNGLRTILRGTLPLELFGSVTYPVVLGRLARPALIAQAATPLVGGYCLQQYGVSSFLAVLAGLALINIGITAIINWRMHRPSVTSINPTAYSQDITAISE